MNNARLLYVVNISNSILPNEYPDYDIIINFYLQFHFGDNVLSKY